MVNPLLALKSNCSSIDYKNARVRKAYCSSVGHLTDRGSNRSHAHGAGDVQTAGGESNFKMRIQDTNDGNITNIQIGNNNIPA